MNTALKKHFFFFLVISPLPSFYLANSGSELNFPILPFEDLLEDAKENSRDLLIPFQLKTF